MLRPHTEETILTLYLPGPDGFPANRVLNTSPEKAGRFAAGSAKLGVRVNRKPEAVREPQSRFPGKHVTPQKRRC